MNIEVTRDNVTILEQSETPHENEYKITTCYFTFDEFTSSFQVKRAIFTVLSTEEMYETDIINNQCDIPSEVLEHEYETVKLGVYGYNIGENEELLNRFSPSYAEIVVPTGSYKEGALSPEPITPSQYDLYSQALQEGLQEVDDKLDEVDETVDGKLEEVDSKLIEVDTTVNNKMTEVDNKIGEVDDKLDEVDDKIAEVDTAITETNNLNLDVSDKVDGDVTVTLTKKDASTKSVVISDGTSLQFMWQGTSLGIKTDDMSEYVFVDLQGIQGVPGPQGEPFRIKKTYSSVAEMNADFNNMEYGDYVMIASTVEVEDNAKLYTRGENQWIFITDFSGATGIKGETGATPNIQIGTVTSGSVPSVTRTGTNENPVLNFVLQPGEKGNTGDTGATGNGIASITKTSTTGLVDTYTITFTDGNTTTFNVENGNGIDHISLTSQSGATKVYTIYYTDGTTSEYTVQDGEVTQEVFDEEVERLKMVYNAMPKVSGEGTDLTLDNTAECPVYDIELSPSALEQKTTTGKNKIGLNDYSSNYNSTTYTSFGNCLNIKSKYGINANLVSSLNTYKITATTNYDISQMWQIVGLNPNTQYIISANISTSLTSGNMNIFSKTLAYNTTNTFTMFTTDSNGEYVFDLMFYGLGAGGTGKYIELTNIQLETGSTVTSFESYTDGIASPNPTYPQQIHTVSGDNSVKVGNKNLAKVSDTNIVDTNYSLNINNGLISVTTDSSNNSFDLCGGLRTGQWLPTSYEIATDYHLTPANQETYILSVQNVEKTISGGANQTINVYTNQKRIQVVITPSGTTGDTTITLEENEYIKSIYLWTNGNSSITKLKFNLQLEKNSQATLYVEHKEQSLPLSLGDLEYCKIGNYEDLFFKNVVGSEYYDSTLELDKWYLKKNVGKVVYDGSSDENWSYYSNGGITNRRFIIAVEDLKQGTNNQYPCISNRFIQGLSNQIDNFVQTTNNSNLVWFGSTDIETLDASGLKTWLSTHNVVLYYTLSTPTYTLLSDTLQTQLDNIQKAISYQEQTNVSQTNNDLPFVIKLSAIRDLSGIFELIQG